MGRAATIVVGGRHDRSAIPRVVPVLRAMVLLTLADAWLLARAGRGTVSPA
jgi:chorismate synthase